MFRATVATLILMLFAAPAGAADPMGSLKYLVGSWNCTYHAGSQKISYTATYAYTMGNNWMRERDSGARGAFDEGSITYDPKARAWTVVVLDGERGTTIFRGKGSGDGTRIDYKSIYPNTAYAETFDRISSSHYAVHFRGTVHGQAVVSNDTCVKQ